MRAERRPALRPTSARTSSDILVTSWDTSTRCVECMFCHQGRSQYDERAGGGAGNTPVAAANVAGAQPTNVAQIRDLGPQRGERGLPGSDRNRRRHPRAWIRHRARTRDRSPTESARVELGRFDEQSRDLFHRPVVRDVQPGTDAWAQIRARSMPSSGGHAPPPRCPFSTQPRSVCAVISSRSFRRSNRRLRPSSDVERTRKAAPPTDGWSTPKSSHARAVAAFLSEAVATQSGHEMPAFVPRRERCLDASGFAIPAGKAALWRRREDRWVSSGVAQGSRSGPAFAPSISGTCATASRRRSARIWSRDHWDGRRAGWSESSIDR